MGTDIKVTMVHGYRYGLVELYERGWLDPSIVECDDWQIIHESTGEERVELIRRYVVDGFIANELIAKGLNVMIVTSSQYESDPEVSYVFFFDKREQVYYGRVPDYVTRECHIVFEPQPHFLGTHYKQHWVVEGSW